MIQKKGQRRRFTYKACVTPPGLLIKPAVVRAASSGKPFTKLTSLAKKVTGIQKVKSFTNAPAMKGRYGIANRYYNETLHQYIYMH